MFERLIDCYNRRGVNPMTIIQNIVNDVSKRVDNDPQFKDGILRDKRDFVKEIGVIAKVNDLMNMCVGELQTGDKVSLGCLAALALFNTVGGLQAKLAEANATLIANGLPEVNPNNGESNNG